MGRRKISIQPITDERNRKVTFVKRKAGLFKKAHELAVLCQVDLAVIILGNNNSKFYEYSSVDIDELLKQYDNKNFFHDTKTPKDYGDYQLISRVQNHNSVGSTHNRNYSANSISLSADGENSSDDDDDEADDDESGKDKESKATLSSKRRKKSANYMKKESTHNVNDHIQNILPPPNLATFPLPQQNQVHPSMMSPQIQRHHQQHQQGYLANQITQIPSGAPGSLQHPAQGSFPGIHFQSGTGHQLGPQYQYPPQNLPPQTLPQQNLPPHFQSPERSGSEVSTPVVQNAKTFSSPFMSSRARTLNSSISSRPVLRVEIPKDSKAVHAQNTSHPGDSAGTVSAVETAKNNENKDGNASIPDENAGDENKPAGLGISSTKSTPVSATLPSALFTLRPPHPTNSQSTNQFHPQFSNVNMQSTNSGGPNVLNSGFKPQIAGLNPGEQTPLTGGLPSRYVPDLFPSPSNFYSNEWNIPFGSGSTPYPNSAGPQNISSMLPNLGGSVNNSKNGSKVKNPSGLINDNIPSPIQNTPSAGHGHGSSSGTSMRGRLSSNDIHGRRIKFEDHDHDPES